MSHTDHNLPCLICNQSISVGGDCWKVVGQVFACPYCGTRNSLYPDEDADGNYWFAFEAADDQEELP